VFHLPALAAAVVLVRQFKGLWVLRQVAALVVAVVYTLLNLSKGE
jgi:hypothetical protein